MCNTHRHIHLLSQFILSQQVLCKSLGFLKIQQENEGHTSKESKWAYSYCMLRLVHETIDERRQNPALDATWVKLKR